MSALLYNRKLEDIIIVDADASRVDGDCLSSMNTAGYDGSLNYSSLTMLKQALKSMNEEQA